MELDTSCMAIMPTAVQRIRSALFSGELHTIRFLNDYERKGASQARQNMIHTVCNDLIPLSN